MKRILEHLRETRNSFDNLLFEYDNSKLLYSYPILAINHDTLLQISPMLNEIADGFYLRNDKIEPAHYPEFMKNQIPDLILQSANRYYNTYQDDKHYKTFYTIYTKESCNTIYDFFDECGEGVENMSPFRYKHWLLRNEIPNNLIENLKSCVVEKKDIVGMVSITSTDIFDGRVGAVFALILNKYVTPDKFVEKFNIYESDSQKLYLNSPYLKSYMTKVLAWAFVHDLKKNSPFANVKIMNDEMKAGSFITYIRENYENFTDRQKNECVFILPSKEKDFIFSQEVVQRTLVDNIMNLFAEIKKEGISGVWSKAMFVDEKIGDLMVIVLKKIDTCRKTALNLLPRTYLFPLISDLAFMNMMYSKNPRAKATIGFWLYYLLYKYRRDIIEEEKHIIDTLLIYALKNNIDFFVIIMDRIKENSFEIDSKNNHSLSNYIKHTKDWKYVDSKLCLYELIFFFSDNGVSHRQKLSKDEQFYWCKRLDEELQIDEIVNYTERTIIHYDRYENEARAFYAAEIYNFIQEEIDKNNYKIIEL